ncbi:MAG TPA: asparagine synthase (glutamine-hydrolyzing) [Bryobacteraceae bacterium]|jgi:asparagine synthase (glutamine-hydrolysing)|nr:asparagine synthase (glutamine-hydrolyzing) [Bryobacteraceae bacterium]
MCAICGIINFHEGDAVSSADVERMSASLGHRGPDDEGSFVEGRAGLGFRRLSIIDLSGGHQPIFNEDGSAAIVFNGEIYNYRDLAVELSTAGHVFSTRSDTETILHAWEQYGENCVDHLRGMFAFAIWDRARRRLLLARDRLGIKPLYYYRNDRFLAFASEIKALLEIPGIPREVDPEALDMYLSLRYVPGPRTMFRNIFRLQPGHLLTLDGSGVRIKKYWDVTYPEGNPAEDPERFRALLDESVRMRLVAEVPLGVFLSGGLDSSAILATMHKAVGSAGIKTFSVGYDTTGAQVEEANEFDYARLAAKTFGADHHEYRLTAAEFQNFVPDLVWHLDEPMADPSCIPLYFISKLAREHVTVILSGEGADEILAGYGIYPRMLALERMNRSVPALDRMAPWLARVTPSEAVRRYIRMSGQSLDRRYRGVCRGITLETRAALIGMDRVRHSEEQLQTIFGGYFSRVPGAAPLNRMLYADAKVWLPDDLLNKADKMTMATSLELRVPFLDHKLVEYAATLPLSAKLGGKGGKTILRNAMRGTLPNDIIDRPKKGFPVPIKSWLAGPLRDFARDNLLPAESACNRYMDRTAVTKIVEEHGRGLDRSQEMWTLLVFEFWHRHFVENRAQRRRAA